MKPTQTKLALLFAMLALPIAAAGQDREAAKGTAPDDAATEEIVVVGKKSLADLRKEVFQSEEDFYALYNKLNDNSEYDVRCYYETPTGTRIKNHVCRARFVSDAYEVHARRSRGDLSRVANQDVEAAIADKSARFQQKLETLIAANPDLEAALTRYNEARARFFAQRDANTNN